MIRNRLGTNASLGNKKAMLPFWDVDLKIPKFQNSKIPKFNDSVTQLFSYSVTQLLSYSVTQLLSYSVTPVYSDLSFCCNRFRADAEIRASAVVVKLYFCLSIFVGSYIRVPI